MNTNEIKIMRWKQAGVTNALILTAMAFFYLVGQLFSVTTTWMFLFLGILILLQALHQILKKQTTKSIIPIFEQVANYEKQKMGSEWVKRQKTSSIWNIFLSVVLFLQSYWARNDQDPYFRMDVESMLITCVMLLIIINIGLIIHFRKIDGAVSEEELKGYTWKSNATGVLLGVVSTFLIIFLTLFFIL